jgi:hypothetical protein
MTTGRYGGRAPDWQIAQDNAVPMGATMANSALQGGYPAPERDPLHGEAHDAEMKEGAEVKHKNCVIRCTGSPRGKMYTAFGTKSGGGRLYIGEAGTLEGAKSLIDKKHGSAADVMSADDSKEFEALKGKREHRGRLSDHEQVRYDQLNALNGRAMAHKAKAADAPSNEQKMAAAKIMGKPPRREKPEKKSTRQYNEDAEPPKPAGGFNRQTGTMSFKRRTAPSQPHPSSPEGVKHTGKQFGQKIGGREAKTISALLRGRH